MDPALGLLTLLGRGPGIAVLPGAARRYAYIKKNHNNNNKNICFGDHCVWNVAVVKLFLEFLLGVKNNVPINRPLPAGTRNTPPRHGQALSTSFEKTCMRQIHSLWSSQCWVINKGPYHAQGLFIIKQTLKSKVCGFLCVFFAKKGRFRFISGLPNISVFFPVFSFQHKWLMQRPLCSKNMYKDKKRAKYSHRGSNSGPLACEASVITN